MPAPTNVRVIPGGLIAEPDPTQPAGDPTYARLFQRRASEIEKLRKALLAAQPQAQAPPDGLQPGVHLKDEPTQAHALPEAEQEQEQAHAFSDSSGQGAGTTGQSEREPDDAASRAPLPEARIAPSAATSDASPDRAERVNGEEQDEATRRQGLSVTGPRKLTDQEVAFAHVAEYLLGRVTEFCSDRAVVANGTWQLQIHVDPKILPGCMLQVWLSGFSLMLRFETEDVTSKTLISRHSGVLRERLTTLLREHGTPREIEIISA